MTLEIKVTTSASGFIATATATCEPVLGPWKGLSGTDLWTDKLDFTVNSRNSEDAVNAVADAVSRHIKQYSVPLCQ